MIVYNTINPPESTVASLQQLKPEITYANNPSATPAVVDNRILFTVEAVNPLNGGNQILWMGDIVRCFLTVTQSLINHLPHSI